MINRVARLGKIAAGNGYPVRIMYILNTSAESFFKKSVKTSKEKICLAVKKAEENGADIIDVGGMSTAPYLSTRVSEKTEKQRVSKAVNIIQNLSNIPISVDTSRSSVAKTVLDMGVEIINDVTGLKYDDMMPSTIRQYEPSVILCAYSKNVVKGNQLTQTKKLLKESMIIASQKAGIKSSKIVLDPAIGFFRKGGIGQFHTRIESDWLQRDILLLDKLYALKELGLPLLVSVSNKSFISRLLEVSDKKDTNKRIYGSLAAEAVAVINGANVIRTHNVRETRDVVMVAQKLSTRIRKGL